VSPTVRALLAPQMFGFYILLVLAIGLSVWMVRDASAQFPEPRDVEPTPRVHARTSWRRLLLLNVGVRCIERSERGFLAGDRLLVRIREQWVSPGRPRKCDESSQRRAQ